MSQLKWAIKSPKMDKKNEIWQVIVYYTILCIPGFKKSFYYIQLSLLAIGLEIHPTEP